MRSTRALAMLGLVLLAGCRGRDHQAHADSGSPFDRPIAQSWPAVNQWSPRLEQEYADFVATIGAAIEARRCRRLDACLRDPAINLTYEPAVDADLRLRVDCADLPYVLRAYFSFKRRLPFGFVSRTAGQGADPRYALAIEPTRYDAWLAYPTPRALLAGMVGRVHSGMYRIAPAVETSDFYPVAIDRRAVAPGAIYYDPNGHVLVVAQVRPDGVVYLIDGHPDGSLTWKRFGEAFAIGTARLGGGFKRFRPVRVEAERLVQAANAELPWFDPDAQYDPARRLVAGEPVGYHAWVHVTLAEDGVTIDPIAEVRDQVRALCRDLADRAEAVDVAIAAGLAARAHPEAMPDNIYGTDGDWETYSTPSRDARFKAAVRELAGYVRGLPVLARALLAPSLRAVWREEAACQISYLGSTGVAHTLTLDDVLGRLFDLSFDPYHCPELRWGAPAGSPERAACPDDADKLRWYDDEARLRNRIDRDYGVPTPLDGGPEVPPDVDVRRTLAGR
ncbi:MAG: hypothetical protein IPL61_37185 [Myxococcales bacterium]|nr:hypothetical protein [Myxococcales bacterium]